MKTPEYIRRATTLAVAADLDCRQSDTSVTIRSNTGEYFHYLRISERGLEAIGEEQGNYSGGDVGRLYDRDFPIRLYMLTSLPQKLIALLWQLQPELLKQSIQAVDTGKTQ